VSSDWLTEAIATRDLERVAPNMGAAGERINDARRHIRSAEVLAEDDTTLAMAACHDAIRKALVAHMSAKGLRVRGGEGAHRTTIAYARHSELGISAEDLIAIDDIRRDRALAEYGDFASRQLKPEQVREAAEVAQRVVSLIARSLSSAQD